MGVNVMIHLLQTDISNESLIRIERENYTKSVAEFHRYLQGINSEMTGWLKFPLEDSEEMVKSIQRTAMRFIFRCKIK